uniref:Chromosome 1 open reading frame 210 n=1 Tax=Steinernema glaseri TaxID=37863 RepID=A0A1I7Y521_9BILA
MDISQWFNNDRRGRRDAALGNLDPPNLRPRNLTFMFSGLFILMMIVLLCALWCRCCCHSKKPEAKCNHHCHLPEWMEEETARRAKRFDPVDDEEEEEGEEDEDYDYSMNVTQDFNLNSSIYPGHLDQTWISQNFQGHIV